MEDQTKTQSGLLKGIFSFFARAIARFSRSKHARSQFENGLPVITERTSIETLIATYPAFESFLHTACGARVSARDRARSLKRFAQVHTLGPAQVLFMRFQMSERTKVQGISPEKLKSEMEKDPRWVIFDVRETWEREWGSLPRSMVLEPNVLEDAVAHWPKDTPMAVVCHFGIRSMDAAAYLEERGFQNVRALEGGVEAWSLKADPSFPRYPGHPC